VRKCQLRKKSGESAFAFDERIKLDYGARPNFYFYREELIVEKSDIEAFELELNQVNAEYQAIINGPIDPHNPRAWMPNDQACNEYFSSCAYLPLDTSGTDLGTKLMFTQRDDLHPELETPNAPAKKEDNKKDGDNLKGSKKNRTRVTARK